jgi:hypothetical protein
LSGEENKEQNWKEEEDKRKEAEAPPKEETKLQLKDWLALFIAALETVLLPFLLLLGVLFVFAIILAILF